MKENYIITACYYAKFPFIQKLGKDCTSKAIVGYFQKQFGEQGIPNKLVSDNGPQFSSTTFKQFAERWDFNHVTTSPHYAQANGFIERNIKTIKSILTKCKDTQTDTNLALLCLRTTPISSSIPSPAELFYNRKIRGNLPVKIDNQINIKSTSS